MQDNGGISFSSIAVPSLIDAIFYSLPDGIAVFGPTGEHTVYANQSFCKIFGYECEMASETYRNISILPAHILAEIRERYPFLDAQQADDTPRYHETTRRDGTPIEVRVTETMFQSNGTTLRLLTVVDVTEQRRLECSKKSAERIIRHDLRDYIASLANAAEIMNALHDDKPASDEMLEYIRATVVQTMDLMESGQQAFLMEEGLYRLTPVTVELHDVVHHAVHMLEPMARTADIAIETDLPPLEEPVAIHGERLLIVRAVTNLLRNALEAEDRGARVQIKCDVGERDITIAVRNPTPVHPDVRERFFEKYVSGRNSGAGLGTYIAKLIMKLHDGSIAMHTSEGAGTTVALTFPRG